MTRTVVGAHYGLRDWLWQRLTAVVIAAYVLFMVFYLAGAQPAGVEAWRALFAQGWLRLFSLLAFSSVFYHAWVGVRDVLMDYVKHTGLRLGLHFAVVVALALYAAWAVQILWSV